MAKYINTAKDCSIRAYMIAGFEGNLQVLVIEGNATDGELITAFEAIQEQYVDLAGLQKSGEFELIKQIRYLRIRLESIYQFIKIHRACLKDIGEPFHPAIKDLKKFGHRLFWDHDNPDPIGFLKALDAIMVKEKRTESELLNKTRELEAIKKRQAGPDITDHQRRISFVSLLNNLGKFGYTIDKDKTTMEELALMVKEYLVTMESQVNDKKSK